jgi:hypothetical protein
MPWQHYLYEGEKNMENMENVQNIENTEDNENVNFDLFYWSGEKDQIESYFSKNADDKEALRFEKIEDSALYNLIIKSEEDEEYTISPDSYILSSTERNEFFVLTSAEFRNLIKEEGVSVSSIGEE